MGYVYERAPNGRLILCCDNCDKAGGARKRRCPYLITWATGKTTTAFPSPALCPACWKERKDGIFAWWKERTTEIQRIEDARGLPA